MVWLSVFTLVVAARVTVVEGGGRRRRVVEGAAFTVVGEGVVTTGRAVTGGREVVGALGGDGMRRTGSSSNFVGPPQPEAARSVTTVTVKSHL